MPLAIELLDNVIWEALNRDHASLAQGDSLARRYNPEFTSLAGLREPSDAAFDSLLKVLNGGKIGLFLPENFQLPPSTQMYGCAPVAQMVCEKLIECKPCSFVELTADDVPQMVELAELTKPGPFANRTIEFGNFIGIKDGDRLVAMAGQRMKLEKMHEVSGVCTHPDYQGRGYARALVREVSQRIFACGNTPFLHVRAENAPGIRSYEAIGFHIRHVFKYGIVGA
jgi:GNAT superfamily N-acetyltransferase